MGQKHSSTNLDRLRPRRLRRPKSKRRSTIEDENRVSPFPGGGGHSTPRDANGPNCAIQTAPTCLDTYTAEPEGEYLPHPDGPLAPATAPTCRANGSYNLLRASDTDVHGFWCGTTADDGAPPLDVLLDVLNPPSQRPEVCDNLIAKYLLEPGSPLAAPGSSTAPELDQRQRVREYYWPASPMPPPSDQAASRVPEATIRAARTAGRDDIRRLVAEYADLGGAVLQLLAADLDGDDPGAGPRPTSSPRLSTTRGHEGIVPDDRQDNGADTSDTGTDSDSHTNHNRPHNMLTSHSHSLERSSAHFRDAALAATRLCEIVSLHAFLYFLDRLPVRVEEERPESRPTLAAPRGQAVPVSSLGYSV